MITRLTNLHVFHIALLARRIDNAFSCLLEGKEDRFADCSYFGLDSTWDETYRYNFY
jgi:hypothetical protein